jgi:hypothetical protein
VGSDAPRTGRLAQSSRVTLQIAVATVAVTLRALAANAPGKLNVLGHDGDALCVNGAKVRVLKETDEVRLGGLLQGEDGGALEAEVALEVLGNLADEALEGQLADEQVGGLLIAADFAQRNRTRAVAMRLLDAARNGRRFASCLGRQLLTWRLSSSRLARRLLRARHRSERERRGGVCTCGGEALARARR